MYSSRARVVAHAHYRRDDMAAILAGLSSLWAEKLETLGLAMLVCAFWGLVLYAAVSYGLH